MHRPTILDTAPALASATRASLLGRLAQGILAVLLTFLPLALRAAGPSLTAEAMFQTERIVEIKIELPAKDWETLTRQTRGFGQMFQRSSAPIFTDFKGDITIDGVTVKSVAIRKKGFIGSLDDYRPSLKITFDEYVAGQKPIAGLDRLTLNNNKQDHTLVSQHLTYRTFRKAGLPAPRVGFARVTVNGEYLGVYSNVEAVRKPFLKAAFGDGSGDRFEGTIADLYPKALDRLEAKGKANTKSLQPLAELLAAEGELDLAKVNELVDVPQFLKFMAVESLIGFWDGYAQNQNNYYLYRNPTNAKYYFIPWGADCNFDCGTGMIRRMANLESSAVYANGMLANRLFWAGDTAAEYTRILQSLYGTAWDEKDLLAEVARIDQLVRPALHERQADNAWSLEQVRQFIAGRREQVNGIIAAGWDNVPKVPRKPMYSVPVGNAEGSFATTWNTETDPAAVTNEGELKLQLVLEGEAVEFASMNSGAGPLAFFGRRGGGPGGPGGRGGPPGGGPPGAGPPGGGGAPGGAAPPAQANIRLTGVRKSDNERLTLSLMVDRGQFDAARDGGALEVGGFLQQGQGGFGFGGGGGRGGGMRSLAGKLQLEAAGANAGDAVKGSFKLEIIENRGGMFGRR